MRMCACAQEQEKAATPVLLFPPASHALQYIKSGLDPTTVAVMLEDGGAVAGLLIAGGCHPCT